MSRRDEAGGGDAAAPGVHAQEADVRLVERLRGDVAAAYPALRELRRRHRFAADTYARLCAVDEGSARQLTGQAFALAAREAKQGIDPGGPWRRHLLLLVRDVAALWTKDERLVRLDPSLAVRLPGEPGEESTLLTAYRDLPARRQGVLWYGVVDEEPDDRTAVFLGLAPDEVTYAKESALSDLRRTFLRKHLSRYGAPQCHGYQRLIEEAARPSHSRHSEDLQTHLTECGCCATAYGVLIRLRDAPRVALAEGLLPWGGKAYGTAEPVGAPGAVATGAGRRRTGARTGQWVLGLLGGGGRHADAANGGRHADAAEGAGDTSLARRGDALGTGRAAELGAGPGARPRGAGEAGGGGWWSSRGWVLGAIAVGVALAPVLLLVLDSGSEPGRGGRHDVAAPATPAPAPAVTVTATVSATPSPSPSASRSAEPTPTTPKPSRHTKRPAPAPSPPGSRYAQVVNVASGLCLDIADGRFANGNDVVTAKCGPSDTQRWRVDADLGALRSFADPDFCLDSRGSTDRGVGIWSCEAIERGTQNLSFSVDAGGTIRPIIALDHAVTPAADGVGATLVLDCAEGRHDQRWRAGASPV